MATVHALQEDGRARQKQAADRDRYRPRAVGLYLGYRSANSSEIPARSKGRLTMPAISWSSFVAHPRHPSRLFDRSDSLRSAWTGPGVDAQNFFLIRENGRLGLARLLLCAASRWSAPNFTGSRPDDIHSAGDRIRAHGKENPAIFYAVRLSSPTRVPSPRQLPTDHDYAVPTRGYQSDQPSLSPLVLSPALCFP